MLKSVVQNAKLRRMSMRRYVYLDPDGSVGDDWLHVVVEAGTGVFYQTQYGGHACRRGQAEGFLVPLFGPDGLDALRALFENHFRGWGTWNHEWSDDERSRLRDGVAMIGYWACDGSDEELTELRLDESRMRDADEAWVPVITADGPGVLVWCNSD
ncbi:DUF6210 family protein [Lentzea cavernae]|uniref:Uncharacterized protein n=1 Tax=Lentzea cavernae TaxID=2020703 RepID=A0ABQ3M0R6_9PSEU|nr:DUF6210 family protein [Lentzea cavernae]GHH30973.1 hypothetical protein GCM10017774_09690 [Lentzea cavernae]